MLTTACSSSSESAAEDAALAQSLLQERRVGEARQAINRAIANDDSEPQYHIIRGRIEFASGAIPNAFNAYNEARALDPSSEEALQAVSQLGLQVGELRASLEATEAILALNPDNVEALVTRGLHAVVRKEYDDADGFADRILAIQPNNEGGVILKARIAFLGGDSGKALDLIDNYSADNPMTAAIALTRLELMRERRDADGLAREFMRLRELAPENTGLRIDEANFAFKTGRKRSGIDLTVARLADPEGSRDLTEQAIDLWEEYDVVAIPDSAIDTIARNGSAAARREVALYLARNDNIAGARVLTASLPPTDRSALSSLILLQAGDREGALAKANALLERDATNCVALTVRAKALIAARQPRKALLPAQEAANQCPEITEAWTIAAQAYLGLGDTENAKRIWRQGMDANPQETQIFRRYVAWLLKSGDTREAVTVARRLTINAPALLSGWRLYRDTCRKTSDRCLAEASRGLADAKTRFGIDLLPGEAPPNGLFGRLAAD
ncbi:MAG: tetratricopeptide repeat protein [Pontixanthobacter sp.]